jgi:hypothetical protein
LPLCSSQVMPPDGADAEVKSSLMLSLSLR